MFGRNRCAVGRRLPGVGLAVWVIASGLLSLALIAPTVSAASFGERRLSQTNGAGAAFRVAARPSRRATRPHRPIRVIGKVRPPAPHQVVLLQERRGGRWRVATKSRLSRHSTFKIRYRPRRPGGQLLRVVKPRFRDTQAGASPILGIVAMARRTVRSQGGRVRLSLGAVQVSAPKGAIQRGKTLTIQTAPPGGPHGFVSTGATSLVGGPYIISTNQGEPSRPVSVRIAYDAGLLSQASQPLFLHGRPKIHDWLPEPTRDSTAGHFATARLTSFSPLDVVDYTTWLAGTITGNRTDLPGNCGEIPDWINGAWFPKDRNDALPSCISNRTDAGTLRINVVNNRGYAQLVRIEGATLDVDRSGSWSDSIDGVIARGFARLSPANGPKSFVLSPGASATIALDRPSDLVGEQPVTIKAAPRGGSAAAQLGWAVLSDLDRVKDEIGNVRDVTNCVIGAIHFETATEVSGSTTIHALHSCLNGAAGIKGAGKAILRKISAAILATDVFQKVIDLTLGETSPARITFSFKGLPQTSRDIKLENLYLGTIPAGQVTDWHIRATGGTPPYTYGISTIPANQGRAPDWAVLSSDGTLSVLPPDETTGSYGFFVFATDAVGQRSATGLYEVTFTVTAIGGTGDGSRLHIQLAAGEEHNCALLLDGSAACWGANGFGQLGNGETSGPQTCLGGPCSTIPVPVTDAAGTSALAAGGAHTCSLLASGSVECWGWEAGAAPAVVPGIGEATAISVGDNHGCAISNGEVRCWGANWDGQLGDGTETSSLTPVSVTGISTAKDIATGFAHTCAVLGDGSVECWGSNGTGQLGDGGGPGSLTPVRVSGIGDAVAIASGYYHTCALRATGEIACWGDGIEGAVGNGGPDAIFPTPQTVSEIDDAVAISAGTNHTCAVLQGGAVKCWGWDRYGQLGDGGAYAMTSGSYRPVLAQGIEGAVDVAAGGNHTCAVTASDNVMCWGDNGDGQLGIGNSSGPETCGEGEVALPCSTRALAVVGLS